MKTERQIFTETIGIFGEKGILPYVILVGSWVELVYETAYFSNFEANLRTRDIDFLVKNIRLPQKRINVINILEEQGYIYDEDPITGVTKFYKDGVLELEFLVKQLGSGQSEPYKVDSLGIKAEGLRNMNILADHTMTLVFEGYEVTVPQPSAYILEKLIINPDRGVKKEKDIRAIKRILECIKEIEEESQMLEKLYNRLRAKQKRKVDQTCNDYGINLFMSR